MPLSSGPDSWRPFRMAPSMKDSPRSASGSTPTSVTGRLARSLITTPGTRTRSAQADTSGEPFIVLTSDAGGSKDRVTSGSSR